MEKRIRSFYQCSLYTYILALLIIVGLFRFCGDRWWFATVLLYGPRWIYAIPMAILLPAAVFWHPRGLPALGVGALIIVFPIMGFNLPWQSWGQSDKPAELRVLTYNVQQWEVSSQEFAELLDAVQPDIAAVQECAPSRWTLPPQWHVRRAQSSLVVSKYPILDVQLWYRNAEVNGICCVIDTPTGKIGFCCIDLLTPRRALTLVLDSETVFNLENVDSAQGKIANRWQESARLAKWVKGFPGPKILAGDFNLTVDSPIYGRYWASYRNAFDYTGYGFGHTKDTKINIFRYPSRIDHILSTPEFRPLRCWTGPDLGSDHLPLIADFVAQ